MCNIDNKIPYETKFEDGNEITDYLAVGVAEGFEVTESSTDVIKAWSYILGRQLHRSLQGWFGRTIQELIDSGILLPDGSVDWDEVDNLINQ